MINNKTIELILERRTYRDFKEGVNLKSNDIKLIEKIFKNSPTWINQQSTSLVIVTDKKVNERIYNEITKQEHILKSAAFIIFVGDYYKINKILESSDKSIDIKNVDLTLINVASHDAGIAYGNISIGLNSIGYNTIPVGAVRDDLKKMSEILNLPKSAFPIIGMSIGKSITNKASKPPRMSNDMDIHLNSYDTKKINAENINKIENDYKKMKNSTYSSMVSNYWNSSSVVKDNRKYYEKIGVLSTKK